MSKKSRRRNKRLLMLAALAGGAAFLGRGKKKFGTDAGFLKSGAAGGASLSSPPILGTDHISPVVKNVKKPIVPKTKDDSWLDAPKWVHGAGSKGDMWRKKKAQITTAVAPPRILNPYTTPRVHNRMIAQGAKGGRVGAKKGGSVTGIAKRGFGRALMKGKK